MAERRVYLNVEEVHDDSGVEGDLLVILESQIGLGLKCSGIIYGKLSKYHIAWRY